MASNIFLYRIPAGVPGFVNREQEHTGEPNQLDVTNPPLAYGDPVKMGSNGKIQALAAGDTAAAIYGFLERPYPTQQQNYASQGYGNAAPQAGARCTVMKRGYMTVKLQGATAAAKGGAVFVRIAGTLPAGGRYSNVEAAVDATAANTPTVPNAYFMGAADTDGNVEIAFNL
jgi:hypothetical protein